MITNRLDASTPIVPAQRCAQQRPHAPTGGSGQGVHLDIFGPPPRPLSPSQRQTVIRTTNGLLTVVQDPSAAPERRLAAAEQAAVRLERLSEDDPQRATVAMAIRTGFFHDLDPAVRSRAVRAYGRTAVSTDPEQREGNREILALFSDPDIHVRMAAMRTAQGRLVAMGRFGFDEATLTAALRDTYVTHGDRLNRDEVDWITRAYRADVRVLDSRAHQYVSDPGEIARLRAMVSRLSRPEEGAARERVQFLLDGLLP